MTTTSHSKSNANEGIFVEVMSDGSGGLAFDTAFHSLAMAEILYRSSRDQLLLREVLVGDKGHPMCGRTGYISALERDTLCTTVLVRFTPDDEIKCFKASQLKLTGKA